MQQRLQQGGFTLVTALALLSGCIAQNPLGVTFTEGGKGAGIASGLVEKTATASPATVSSMANSIASSVTILEFTVKENGSRDGYPLQIKELRFTNTGTGDASDFRFVLEGPGSNNTVGTSSGQVVTFRNFGDIIVPDGETTGRTYQVKLHVRENIQGTTTDNQTVLLNVSPTVDFDVTETSSNILPAVSAFQQSPAIAMNVVATHLRGEGTFQFSTVARNTDFPGTQSIYAQDLNKRIDKDFNFVIQLTPRTSNIPPCDSAAAGSLTSTDGGTSKAAVQGVASWTDLKYDAIQTIRVFAASPAATPAITQNECTAAFDVTGP